MGTASVWHWLIILVVLAIYIVPAWVIARKAGYHPALSLLILLPLVNIVVLWLFAFSAWPALKRPAA